MNTIPIFIIMAIATYTIQFNEYELETIAAALADYRAFNREELRKLREENDQIMATLTK